MRNTLSLAALLVAVAGTAMAQDRPPIALPAPSQPIASQPGSAPNLAADILALSMAMEQSGCRLNARNMRAVQTASGLTTDQTQAAREALLISGMAGPDTEGGGIVLQECLDRLTPPEPAPAEPVASTPVERPPLTLLQRRRCADRPNLSFCR